MIFHPGVEMHVCGLSAFSEMLGKREKLNQEESQLLKGIYVKMEELSGGNFLQTLLEYMKSPFFDQRKYEKKNKIK